MGLETYHKKRDFRRTPEPKGKVSKVKRHRFVVQEHHASKLHFDFRLEMGGVLKSWSIPKGPSLDPSDKRFAVPTEDHPVEYLKFQGHIPEGNYGAGRHMIWDAGRYELVVGQDPLAELESGRLNFRLHGDKLQGEFNLIRMGKRDDQWLLIKSRDRYAEPGWKLKLLMPEDDDNDDSSSSKTGARAGVRGVKKAVKKSSAKAKGEVIPASRFFKARELSGDAYIRVGQQQEIVSLTHLDKVYWPEDGYTKGDLIRYYYEVSKYILPYLKDRPLIMKRYPNGIEGQSFHQHDVNEVPEFVRTATLDVEEGHEVDYIIGDNAATLLYMANLGAIERHPWHSRLKNLDRPDWLVFDLDPGEGIAFSVICELALGVKDVLERVRLDCYAKTSGSRGLHVYVPFNPRYTYAQVADFAERVARLVAHEHQRIATVERALKKRERGQIYLDHMQNARGKSVVAPYSVRPKAGATVSAPLRWSEVEERKITIRDFDIRNMVQRIARYGDLFKPVLSGKQSLDESIEKVKELAGK
ncbi:MAG TPA: non-homologous end-joining DNA ligase [Pyrinomonadaceae bacterium]|jgi:bifunctional non-homologous end joining protein LigD|nr:non-homologous end-joining DNA ligase [Pyrinomonadaceae bacterium]